MRIGAHPGYERMVFDLPSGETGLMTQDGAVVTLRFSVAGRPAIPPGVPANVQSIRADEGSVAITLSPRVRVRSLHLGDRLVLDLLDPPAPATPPPATPAPAPPALAAPAPATPALATPSLATPALATPARGAPARGAPAPVTSATLGAATAPPPPNASLVRTTILPSRPEAVSAGDWQRPGTAPEPRGDARVPATSPAADPGATRDHTRGAGGRQQLA